LSSGRDQGGRLRDRSASPTPQRCHLPLDLGLQRCPSIPTGQLINAFQNLHPLGDVPIPQGPVVLFGDLAGLVVEIQFPDSRVDRLALLVQVLQRIPIGGEGSGLLGGVEEGAENPGDGHQQQAGSKKQGS